MSDSASTDSGIGTRVGEYLISALLGVGGMGKVYRATGSDGTEVALKLVKEDYARDEIFRRRFLRESRIAQSIYHPNVVPVVATGEENGIPYMAQRFVDGPTLEQRIKQDGPLDPATAVRICADVAAGLEALWAGGMVHRDVKSANILLDREGTACVTDFGLAKDTQGSVLTLPGQAVGSMDYMAPEQIRGEDVSAACDIYALGCVMYEALTGKPPFYQAQGMRILWAHLQDDPADPRTLRPDLPEKLAAALPAALAKEPHDRPSSAGEYARMLQAGLEGPG